MAAALLPVLTVDREDMFEYAPIANCYAEAAVTAINY